MTDERFESDAVRPELWNPNAAVNWSLCFTPLFGTWLHAANWHALGRPGRALTSRIWFGALLAFLLVRSGSLLFSRPESFDVMMRHTALGLLAAWYFGEGRLQGATVAALPHGYVKRSWGRPLAVAAAVQITFLALTVFVVGRFGMPNHKQATDAVRSGLTAANAPDGIEVEDLKLEPMGGGGYIGEAVLRAPDGTARSERLHARAFPGNRMRWSILEADDENDGKPKDAKDADTDAKAADEPS